MKITHLSRVHMPHLHVPQLHFHMPHVHMPHINTDEVNLPGVPHSMQRSVFYVFMALMIMFFIFSFALLVVSIYNRGY